MKTFRIYDTVRVNGINELRYYKDQVDADSLDEVVNIAVSRYIPDEFFDDIDSEEMGDPELYLKYDYSYYDENWNKAERDEKNNDQNYHELGIRIIEVKKQ